MKDVKYKFTDKELQIFEHLGTVVCSGSKKYYFLPFWIEKDDSDDYFKMHKLGNLPEDLKKLIEDHRIIDRINKL